MTDAAELEPPWSRLPEIQQGSIGWRMGGGEDYLYRWFAFVREHWPSRADALRYLRRHPPAPQRWSHFVIREVLEADKRAGIEPPTGLAGQALTQVLRGMLEADGLIADDVAYPAYVRNHLAGGELPPPWQLFGGEESLEKCLRYSMRELGWWARWFAADHPDPRGKLMQLEHHAAPPHWGPVLEQLRAGTSTAWRTLHEDAGLISSMALHGSLAPPWTGDHPPLDRPTSWETASSDDRDRWLWWVHRAFDDKNSWRAYLERWPAPPASWRALIDERLRAVGTRFLD